jgi:hypothetical protein
VLAVAAPVGQRRFLDVYEDVIRRQRPSRTPPELRWTPTKRADRGCQRRTAVRRRRVTRLVFLQAELVMRRGLPYEKVIDQLAIGTSQLQRRYWQVHGERPSRATLLGDLEAIFGSPTGRLGVRWSDDAEQEGQANTYSIRNVHITLGRLGRKLMRKLVELQLSIEFGDDHHGVRSLSTKHVSEKAKRALRKALENAVNGTKHLTGLRLAWRLAHLGVPEATAHQLLTEYRRSVPSDGRRYEAREARRAVESAYRKVTLSVGMNSARTFIPTLSR